MFLKEPRIIYYLILAVLVSQMDEVLLHLHHFLTLEWHSSLKLLNMRDKELTRDWFGQPIPWPVMTWRSKAPGHQEPWYRHKGQHRGCRCPGFLLRSTITIVMTYFSRPIAASAPGSLFTKRQDVLPPNLAKSRSRKIWAQKCAIAMKFDSRLGSGAAETPVKFQSDTII